MLLLHFVRRCYRAAKEKLSVTTEFFFFLAVVFLLVPIQWFGAWVLALSFHELCHYTALRLCGGEVAGIQIGCRGITIKTQPLSFGKEAFCAYAGPLGGLVVLLFARYLPRTAICELLFSAYNLLPIFPLDGGRGLTCILKKFLPTVIADRVSCYVENGTLLSIFVIAIYAVFRLGLGLLPAVISVIVLLRSKGIKLSCKKVRLGLQ